jgi:hypothetical protein
MFRVDDGAQVYDVIVGNILAVCHNEDGELIFLLEDDLPSIPQNIFDSKPSLTYVMTSVQMR